MLSLFLIARQLSFIASVFLVFQIYWKTCWMIQMIPRLSHLNASMQMDCVCHCWKIYLYNYCLCFLFFFFHVFIGTWVILLSAYNMPTSLSSYRTELCPLCFNIEIFPTSNSFCAFFPILMYLKSWCIILSSSYLTLENCLYSFFSLILFLLLINSTLH